jgi:hypothetical protein
MQTITDITDEAAERAEFWQLMHDLAAAGGRGLDDYYDGVQATLDGLPLFFIRQLKAIADPEQRLAAVDCLAELMICDGYGPEILEPIQDLGLIEWGDLEAGSSGGTSRAIAEAYLGSYDRAEDWAYEYAEAVGAEGLGLSYFDAEAFLRDCQLGGDIYVDKSSGRALIFWAH